MLLHSFITFLTIFLATARRIKLETALVKGELTEQLPRPGFLGSTWSGRVKLPPNFDFSVNACQTLARHVQSAVRFNSLDPESGLVYQLLI